MSSIAILACLALGAPDASGEDQALALVPQLIAQFQPQLEPAELAWAQSQFAEALAHKRTPDRAWASVAAGASLLGHDRLAAWAALSSAESAWRPATLNNVGIALLRLDRLDQAQVFCDRALELDSRCVFALEARAAIALARKDAGGSRSWIEHALALRPDDPELLYSGAIVAQKAGDAALARQRIRRARKLRPKDPAIAAAAAALDPSGSAPSPASDEHGGDGLARLVAELNAHFDRIHELAIAFDDDSEQIWKARAYPIDRARAPFSQKDIDADLAGWRNQIAEVEKDFRGYRGASGYANGKWNYALERCVLAYIQATTRAEEAWWGVDSETRVLARALCTTPARLYAATDSGAVCSAVGSGSGADCYYAVTGGAYAHLLFMEKDHGFGRAYWEGHEQKNRDMEACRKLKGPDEQACKDEAIKRFCEMLSARFGAMEACVQSSVDMATGNFPRALAAELLQTATVTSDGRDFARRALALLRPIGDAKIEAQTGPWTPKAVVAAVQESFAVEFGGLVQWRKQVLTQSKLDLVEAQAALERYVASAKDWIQSCGGGNDLRPKTLDEEIEALLAAFEEAGKFEASTDVECEVEIPGMEIEIKPSGGEGLLPDVQVKLGEKLKVIDSLTGERRGVGVEVGEANGLAGKVEVSIVREGREGGEPEYTASIEGKLGVGVEHHHIGIACYCASVGAEVDLRALFENYAEAMRR